MPGKYNELWRYGAHIENEEEEQREEKLWFKLRNGYFNGYKEGE